MPPCFDLPTICAPCNCGRWWTTRVPVGYRPGSGPTTRSRRRAPCLGPPGPCGSAWQQRRCLRPILASASWEPWRPLPGPAPVSARQPHDGPGSTTPSKSSHPPAEPRDALSTDTRTEPDSLHTPTRRQPIPHATTVTDATISECLKSPEKHRRRHHDIDPACTRPSCPRRSAAAPVRFHVKPDVPDAGSRTLWSPAPEEEGTTE